MCRLMRAPCSRREQRVQGAFRREALQEISRAIDGPLDEAVVERPPPPLVEGNSVGVARVVVEELGHLVAKLLRADEAGDLAVVLDRAEVEVGRPNLADALVD